MSGQGFPFCINIEAVKVRHYLVILAILILMAGCSKNDGGAPASQAPAALPQAAENDAAKGPEEDSYSPEEEVAGNTSPEIRKVWFVGGDGSTGNTLGIEFETFDADEDVVTVGIVWSRNGESAGTGKYISSEVRRDDKITVVLTPSDGKTTGRPVTLTRQVTNSPPSIQGHDQFQFDGNTASFQMLASDPDGDTLSYALNDAPAGMTIDRNTGRIRWEVPPETTGKISFMVEVSDGFGGSAKAPLSITIAPQPDPESETR